MILPRFTSSGYLARKHLLRGVSLVEMLVVVAIIGALAMLMMPVLGKMRESSLSVKCTGQLRNVGVAFHRYIQDMNGRIVTRRGGNRGGSVDLWGAELSGRGYLTEPARKDGHRTYTGTDPAMLLCPAIRNRPAAYGSESWAWFTYGLNLFTSGVKSAEELGTPLSVRYVSTIEEPSRFILLADSVTAAGAPSFRIRSGDGGLALAHGNVGNALYFDGHIAPLTRQQGLSSGFPAVYDVTP